MDKYLKRRWVKAQYYTVTQVAGSVSINKHTDTARLTGQWLAPSSMGGEWHTHAALDTQGRVCSTACNCPDYGQCTWSGYSICKHTLALCIYLTLVRKGGNVSPSSTLGATLAQRGK